MNPFQCPIQNREYASLLLDYCDRRLDPELNNEMERHLDTCADCRQMLASQRVVWEALDAWDPEPVSMDFNRRLFDRIDAEKSRPWWRRAADSLGSLSWKPAVPVAAACMALVAVVLLRTPALPDLDHKAKAEPAAVDVEQVDRALDDMDMLRQLGVNSGTLPAGQSL